MRTQDGGNIWAAINTGKVIWVAENLYEVKVGGQVLQGYPTTANGKCPSLTAKTGEFIKRVRTGNPYQFSRYAIGTREEVEAYID